MSRTKSNSLLHDFVSLLRYRSHDLTAKLVNDTMEALMKQAKKILSYFAIFDPAEEGGYNVSFPEFPGCYTFGRTFEEANHYAEEALELWLEVMAKKREQLPHQHHRPIVTEVRVATRANVHA